MYKKLQILCLIAATQLLGVSYPVTLTTDSPSTTSGEGAPGELRYGINQINQGIGGFDVIDFSGVPVGSTISLNGPLPILNLSNSDLTLIIGNGVNLDGGTQYPGFCANQGSITIEDFNFQNCTSLGGDGGNGRLGGSGGPGLGGALFIIGAAVTLDNVNFTDSVAQGGNPGISTFVPTDGTGGGGGMWSFFNGAVFTARGGDGGPGAGGGGGGLGASGGDVSVMDFGAGGGGVSGGPSPSGRGADSAAIGSSGAGFDAFGSFPGGMGFGGGAGGLFGGGGGGAGALGGGGGGGNAGADSFGPTGGDGSFSGGGGGGGSNLGDGGDALFIGGGGGGGSSVTAAGGASFVSGLIAPITFGGAGGGAPIIPGVVGSVPFGGRGAGGAIYVSDLGGNLIYKGKGTITNSRASAGTDLPPGAFSINGQSFFDQNFFNFFPPPLQLVPDPGETITISDPFITFNRVEVTGGGTVISELTDVPAFPFPPDFSYFDFVFGLDIGDGITPTTFNLKGTTIPTPEGDVTFPLLVSLFNPINIASESKFTGKGSISLAGPAQINLAGTIEIEPGIIFVNSSEGIPEINASPGGRVVSQVTSTQAGTLFVEHSVNFSPATLEVVFDAQSAPTNPSVYTIVQSSQPFANVFGNTIAPPGGNVVYTPAESPNSAVLTFNVPDGISNADLFFGEQSIPALVLSDPCAGLVVLNLLAPGAAQSAIDSFFANQSTLTLQALAGNVVSVNTNLTKKSAFQTAAPGSPLAAFYKTRELIVQNDLELNGSKRGRSVYSEVGSLNKQPQNSFSITPFGQYQEQDSVTTSDVELPAYRAGTKGVILGYDYLGAENFLIGGALTYAYTDLNQSQNLGNQKIQTALGSFYSSFILDHLFMNVLVTGGYNYNSGVRNIKGVPAQSLTVSFNGIGLGELGPQIIERTETLNIPGIPDGKAASKYNSWQLAPHFDINYEFGFDFISLVPFILSDCIMNFADSFTETGDNTLFVTGCGDILSLNNVIDDLTSFMLQNEAGLNLFERVDMQEHGMLIFRQKASYVNRYAVPYTFVSRFVTDPEFTETQVALPMQHFFGSSAEILYRINQLSLIWTYEGFVGSGYASHAGYFRVSADF